MVFLVAFISTFLMVESIQETSKKQITEKIVIKTSPNVDIAEEAINSQAGSKYLAKYQREVIQAEINNFKQNPTGYIEEITLDESQSNVIPPVLQSGNPLKNAFLEKIFGWKNDLKTHFNQTFSQLIIDIRIFLISNVMALLIAAFICYKKDQLGKDAFFISKILTVIIAFSSLSYFDQNWFFTILLNRYYGYGYIFGIFITTAWVYYQYQKNKKA